MSREAHVRFCESLGVKLPGATRQHRMFSAITMNWRAHPLTTLEVIVKLIGATTTKGGLRIDCRLDEKTYDIAKKVSDEELARLNIEHPENCNRKWNYTIRPDVKAKSPES